MLAYAGAAIVLAVGSRIPEWGFHVVLVTGSVLITRAVLLSGEAVSFYAVWFIWIGLYSFYFFGRRAAAAQIAFVSALYAFTLFEYPPGSSVARWLTTVATLLVAGGFIDTLVHRARRQAQLAARAAGSLARLAAAAHELAALTDPAEARVVLCRSAAAVTGARNAALWEVHDDVLVVTAHVGEAPEPARIPLGDRSAQPARALAAGERIASSTRLWQPIVREDAAGAVLALDFDSHGAFEDGSATSLTSLLATETLITLDRLELLERLAAIARTDELTGLLNRRAWEERAPVEIERARREGTPVCAVMLDLDRFKAYNDRRGHQAGDRLLKEAAAAWGRELRSTDVLARYGGEEFALLLPGCLADQAQATVDRVRAATPEGQACSAGIAAWDGAESAFELLGRADAALYAAKRAGRDRSEWAAGPA